jgi:hypothetical protein
MEREPDAEKSLRLATAAPAEGAAGVDSTPAADA